MGLTPSDIKQYQSINMPISDSATSGGAISLNEITSVTIGELLPNGSANQFGDPDVVRRYKFFVANKNTDVPPSNLENAKIYLYNGLSSAPSAGVVSLTPSSALDAANTSFRCVGFTSSNPVTEFVAASGTNTVTGVQQFAQGSNGLLLVQAVDANSGLKKVMANGNVTIYVNGNIVGYIPMGYSSAIGFLKFVPVSVLNDNVSIATRLDALPGGLTTSKPNTYATGLLFANNGVLPASSAQGIWVEEYLYAGLPNTRDFDIVFRVEGDSV